MAQQRIAFEASVGDSRKVAIDDYITVTLTLHNATADRFTPPAFTDFKIAGGPSRGSEMAIVNGEVAKAEVYSYVLQPKHTGRCTVGAAAVSVRGKTYTTQALAVEVVKSGGTNTPQNVRPHNSPNGGDLAAGHISETEIAKSVRLRAEPAKQSVYVGEPLVVNYTLTSRYEIGEKRLRDVPKFEGFFPIELRQFDAAVARGKGGGKNARVQTLRRVLLIPQRSGKLLLDPISFLVDVVLPNPSNAQRGASLAPLFDPFSPLQNPFGFGGVGRLYPLEITTDVVPIVVRDLPAHRPSDFGGAVGQFDMNLATDRTDLTTDDALRLTLTIKGVGDAKRISVPLLGIDTAMWETYDPQIHETTTETPDGLTVQKVFEWSLVPRIAALHGQTVQSSLAPTFTYFDTDAQTFRTLRPKPALVSVREGKNSAKGSKAHAAATKINPAALAAPKTELTWQPSAPQLLGTWLLFGLMLLPLLGLLGIAGYKRLKASHAQLDRFALRQLRARTVAQKQLREAAALLRSTKSGKNKDGTKAFYRVTERALYGYLTDKFGIQPQHYSKAFVAEYLATESVASTTIGRLIEVLHTCEMALFADTANTYDRRRQVYADAIAIIDALEG